MMKRLPRQGLVENTPVHAKRQARAWRLTADGEAVIDAHRTLKQARRKTRKGGKLVAVESTRRGQKISQARTGFRMTVLTHEVLTAVANLSGQGSNPSNRELAHAAGVKDEGQISKLLARLQTHGLLENTGGHTGPGNAWQLTLHGEETLSASRPLSTSVPTTKETR